MVTIKDIAKVVGVSPSTVSLALNNSNLVKLETKYKVLQVARELNYTPNQYARSLVTKENRIIGVAWMTNSESTNISSFDGHSDTYLTEMIPSISKEIIKSNYSMLFEHYHINDSSMQLPSIMNNNRVDGMLIFGGIVNDSFLERIKASRIPTVLVGSRHDEIDYVDTDPEVGIFLATEHLILKGHRDIVFINSSKSSQSSARKLKGFISAMNKYGVTIRNGCLAQAEFSGKAAYDVMHSLWEKGVCPTAIVGGYDAISIGALRFLYEKGYSCPGDISVIGFEDNILADYSFPPLTTVKINKSLIGLSACKVLIDRIQRPNAKKVHLIIKPELLIRESTKSL